MYIYTFFSEDDEAADTFLLDFSEIDPFSRISLILSLSTLGFDAIRVP
jgi:hypothetical protein